MNKMTIIRLLFVLLSTTCIGCASECAEGANTQPKNPVDEVLEQLDKKTSEIKSYECRIEYKYIQKLPESEALRKGVLYYLKSGRKSAMRINFNTLKQEDEPEQKYMEQYIVIDGERISDSRHKFEGLWLVHLDYEMSEAKYYQVAEPNDNDTSEDVFDLAGRNLPILGFGKIDKFKEQFDIELVEQKNNEAADFTQLHLKVKPNSVYKDDYISIDFWIDKKLGLPVKIYAVTTEPEPPYGDVYEIKLLRPEVNKTIDEKVFDFKLPAGFGEPDIVPLKKDNQQG